MQIFQSSTLVKIKRGFQAVSYNLHILSSDNKNKFVQNCEVYSGQIGNDNVCSQFRNSIKHIYLSLRQNG